jgi:hypothetical protein
MVAYEFEKAHKIRSSLLAMSLLRYSVRFSLCGYFSFQSHITYCWCLIKVLVLFSNHLESASGQVLLFQRTFPTFCQRLANLILFILWYPMRRPDRVMLYFQSASTSITPSLYLILRQLFHIT